MYLGIFSSLGWLTVLVVMTLLPLLCLKFYPKFGFTLADGLLMTVVSFVMVFGTYHLGVSLKVTDVETISGEIVSKKREHDTYQESYSCNCNNDGCKTCYRTIYTVTWYALANIGRIKIDYDESRSSSVYAVPDTARYKKIQIGEPASLEQEFVNYVKANPDSVFAKRVVDVAHKDSMKDYPSVVYDFYRANRVVNFGTSSQPETEWNKLLAEKHKVWGPKNHANVMLVFTNLEDHLFANSLKNHWLQGKQNDIVLVISTKKDEPDKINWVEIFGWTKSELMKLELKDEIEKLGSISDKEAIINILDKQITENFKVRNMEEDFEYLRDGIEPPWFWLIYAVLACIFGSFAATAAKYYAEHRLRR